MLPFGLGHRAANRLGLFETPLKERMNRADDPMESVSFRQTG